MGQYSKAIKWVITVCPVFTGDLDLDIVHRVCLALCVGVCPAVWHSWNNSGEISLEDWPTFKDTVRWAERGFLGCLHFQKTTSSVEVKADLWYCFCKARLGSGKSLWQEKPFFFLEPTSLRMWRRVSRGKLGPWVHRWPQAHINPECQSMWAHLPPSMSGNRRKPTWNVDAPAALCHRAHYFLVAH